MPQVHFNAGSHFVPCSIKYLCFIKQGFYWQERSPGPCVLAEVVRLGGVGVDPLVPLRRDGLREVGHYRRVW